MTQQLPNDLSAFWMPFTANRQYKTAPRLLAAAEGMFYTDVNGRPVLDGTSGLWCCNAGHNRPKITQAIREQAGILDFAPTFQMGHPLVFELANRLRDLAPAGIEHVFFTNSGSESVETALKIALAYHSTRGEGHRTRLIGRARGYHGVNFGGVSVGGIGNNRRQFGSLLTGVDHLPDTHLPEQNAFTRGQPVFGAERADALKDLIALHGADTIAAVIVEPVAGSTGVLIPPKGYLQRLREITAQHGILLIFDEVITGFGRLGAPFAADYFGVTPDLITTAKGLTNGAVPMGAVLASGAVHDAFMAGPENMIELFHGYTYSGHPLAAAAALASLETYAEEDLFNRAAQIAPQWEEALHSLKGLPHVVDIRTIGLVGAIELTPRPGAPGARAYDAFVAAFEAGCLIRVTGDIIALSPPLILEQNHIDQLVDTLRAILSELD
ncbi:MAG: aspartate aminotransferase family protein [Magnetospiraceae bacterium]